MLQKMVKNDVCCCGVCKHCHCKRHQGLKERELAFLLCLRQIPFLPVCAFAMGDGVNDQSDRIVFAPFYLLEPSESFERLLKPGCYYKGLLTRDLSRWIISCRFKGMTIWTIGSQTPTKLIVKLFYPGKKMAHCAALQNCTVEALR